jgi:hypothetical protein
MYIGKKCNYALKINNEHIFSTVDATDVGTTLMF